MNARRLALTNSKLKKFKTSSLFVIREEKGRDKAENPPQPPLPVCLPDDPQGLLHKLGLHMQQVKGETQVTIKNIEITLKPGKIRDS